MTNKYYNEIGSILRDSLTNDKDPFEEAANYGKRRTMAGRMERRPPPKLSYEEERVPVPFELVEDFAVLNVLPGVPLKDCKKAWKLLLKKYHPDLSTDLQINSGDIIRRINNSYKKIETWFTTGKILTDKDSL